jgi:tRNA G18 (ribose-2'-O)-methylase SpoU
MIGVDTECLKECDALIALPTHGVKNSLNVATCVSVVIWEALRQWDALQDETMN